MSANSNHRKSRAVRLTDEALALLRVRLAEEAERRKRGRLTRPLKAELMDVSITTSERILGQKGNDRAVLVHAFERLGIPWSEECWEPAHVDEEQTAADAPEPDRGPQNQTQTWRRAAAAAVAVLATASLVAFVSHRLNGRQAPAIETDRRMLARAVTEARDAYDRADYDAAARQVAEAFRIAQHHRLADAMADCLRLEGDVLAAQGHLEDAATRYRHAIALWGPLEAGTTTISDVSVHYSPGLESRSVDHGLACVVISNAVVEARLGRLDEAEEQFHRALVLCQSLDDQPMVGAVMRGLGSVEAVRGKLGAARRWYDAAALTLKDRPDPAFLRDLRALRALLLRDEEHLDRALSELESCLAEWRKASHPRWIATTLLQIASVQAAAGRVAPAIEAATEAQRLYGEVGDRRGIEVCEPWRNEPPTPHPHHRFEEFF